MIKNHTLTVVFRSSNNRIHLVVVPGLYVNCLRHFREANKLIGVPLSDRIFFVLIYSYTLPGAHRLKEFIH